jgi:hypothetical protein
MSVLPRVTELTRERIAREFDDIGPEPCLAAIRADLEQHNPELLDMASRWAAELGALRPLMTGFGMFYRLLTAEARAPLHPGPLSPLPRVSHETRDLILARIDEVGGDVFAQEAIDALAATNPELMQMAHAFASHQRDYLRTMQGFALLHQALLIQSVSDRSNRH